MIFDGRAYAKIQEEKLKSQVAGKKLKLVALLDATNPGAVTYTNLKQKFAERIGVEFKIINNLEEAGDANGILVQLPYPNSAELIAKIDSQKDIDGLKDKSPYKPAVVRAVREILDYNHTETADKVIGIVGALGNVGQKLLLEFPEAVAMDKTDFDVETLKTADIIISATGVGDLIKPTMVKNQVVAIDLGFPQGDFNPEVEKHSRLFTPVPGGVGPVTVACLFKNLLDSVHD